LGSLAEELSGAVETTVEELADMVDDKFDDGVDEELDKVDEELETDCALPTSIVFISCFSEFITELCSVSVEHPARIQSAAATDKAALKIFFIYMFPKICI